MIFVFIRQSPNLHKDSFRCRWPCIRFGWICETREKKKTEVQQSEFSPEKMVAKEDDPFPFGQFGPIFRGVC